MRIPATMAATYEYAANTQPHTTSRPNAGIFAATRGSGMATRLV